MVYERLGVNVVALRTGKLNGVKNKLRRIVGKLKKKVTCWFRLENSATLHTYLLAAYQIQGIRFLLSALCTSPSNKPRKAAGVPSAARLSLKPPLPLSRHIHAPRRPPLAQAFPPHRPQPLLNERPALGSSINCLPPSSS